MLSEQQILAHFAGWDLDPEEQRYLDYHSRRFAFVLRIVGDCVAQARRNRAGAAVRLLDIGPHFLTELLSRSFADATISTLGYQNPRCYRGARIGRHLEFDLNDAQHPHQRPSFDEHDVVVMSEVIEHLYTAPELVLEFVKELMAPGGFLVVQTPNAVAWDKRVVMLRGANPFEMLRQSRQNPGHFREYTAHELRQLGDRAGLECTGCERSNYFNAPLGLPARLACRLRPGFCQGITIVYRRPAAALRQIA